MPPCPALRHLPAALRSGGLILLALVALARPSVAHEGHDHGAAPDAIAAGLPRAEAHSNLFEVVAILQPGGALAITLDRFADNSPLDGAVTLTLDGQEAAVERQGIGLFVVRHPLLERPGRRDLVFTVTAGEDMDLLTATLLVPVPAAAASTRVEVLDLLRDSLVQIGIGIGLLVVGLLLGRASVRRPLPPAVEDASATHPAKTQPAIGRRAAALLVASVLATAPASAQQSPVTGEAPRRLQDGAIFVPKPSQRLLGLRTQITESGEASAALRMIGTLVPDPNASGRVQPSQNGRLNLAIPASRHWASASNAARFSPMSPPPTAPPSAERWCRTPRNSMPRSSSWKRGCGA